MSFLNWPIEQPQTARRQKHRKAVVLELLGRFRNAFPEINYDLLWDSPTINAQAWIVGPDRNVRIYGGLVRHPTMTRSGLALSIAHETGHHLGGHPRDPEVRWMTWQGQADYWAASAAMPVVFGPEASKITLRGARQIVQLQTDLAGLMEGDEPDLSADCRYRIFCAGASNTDIPACAKEEFRECFNCNYPEA